MRPNASNLIITTSVQGTSHSQVWDTSKPLALGHPFQWIVEKTKDGVRVRDISGKQHKLHSGSVQEISNEKIRRGAEIELPRVEKKAKHPFKLRIVPAGELSPAFTIQKGNKLTLFLCLGNWVLESVPVEKRYVSKINGNEAFTLTKNGGQYTLAAKTELRSKSQTIAAGTEVKFAEKQILDLTFSSGGYIWRFGMVGEAPTLPAGDLPDEDQEWFKKYLRYVAIGFGAFMIMTWLWPKPQDNPQEIIPAQVARIIMTQPKHETAAPASGAEKAPQTAVAKKVEQAAVVQAFRAKALQNSISSLLKGGMTQLLTQSDFVTGEKASANARSIFNTKSRALMAIDGTKGLNSETNVNVASIGGAASGKGAVGYGKGEHAGVNGQGHSFVSMDVGNSTVEEGLTKDEVGEVIRRHMSEVRYCYESAMLRTPDIEGKLVLDFVVGGSGAVKSSEIKSSTLPDPRLDDCIIRRLVTWKFPNPKGGVDVAVSYPFIFKTLGR